MSDDLLRRASEALRKSTDGSSARAAETRSRLVASAKISRRRTRRLWMAALPLAAALAVSTAWAGATGRLPAVWQAVKSLGEPVPAAHRDTGPAAAALARAIASSPAASSDTEPAAAPEPSVPVVSSPSAPAPSASVHEDAGDADHAAYLVAHRTHFGGGDPAASLQAWDGYLRAFPSGRFSLEARYNRALCLVKLGRNAEASQALEPFARGAYGTYRQAEAKALREAMGN
ncbi:MAG: hypothetical protein HY898_35195 [Deltaproteobacteria bacterium]|nr:hypothetical protein [Deltaproteobacteria bacterium]